MEAFERRQPLQASERPLRATGPRREKASGEPGSFEPVAGENGYGGAERRNDPALSTALLRAAHVGSGQDWESDHLEPFSLGARRSQLTPLTRRLLCGWPRRFLRIGRRPRLETFAHDRFV